jgi:type I restriction enzyme, R subunit
MSNISASEKDGQNRIITLFKQLGYEYVGNLKDRPNNQNIEVDKLNRFWATSRYTEAQKNTALEKFQKAANNLALGLFDRNKAVYSLLRFGVKVSTGLGEKHETIHLIDWAFPERNDFYVAEEVKIKDKRPDIVLYVNGIAICVIELKKSTVSISEGIRQNLDNQTTNFIEHFFSTIQLVVAGNYSQGLHYGVVKTEEKYFLKWKEDTFKDYDAFEAQILQMFDKSRLIELMYDFMVYDRGIKKICRPHQYFGVKAAQERLKGNEGGVIFHTQGSGKSLTMVWLANWILENINDSRLLIITDRDELDTQIKNVFEGVNQQIYRSKNGKDLIKTLNETKESLICSLVHKFGLKKRDTNGTKAQIAKRTDEEYEAYINELMNELPQNFKVKGKMFVFVDECHRTQSGMLNKAMKKILPDAIFVGFSGTPLLKTDKNTTYQNFGSLIHSYKFDKAVRDEVVLDLRYEARNVEQKLTSQEKIDKWFDAKTSGLKENAKAELKRKWGTMQKVLSSKSRLEVIALDIIHDMSIEERLKSGRGNAMLVAGSIYEACKYYEIFTQNNFKRCAIITSYTPQINDLKGETVNDEEETQKIEQYEIYQKMLNGKDVSTFEAEVKKKFLEEPAQMKLLIVVDKLLTGFDAPPCTYLYIDKGMYNHGLFQAICRVNRLHDKEKEFGYIVDYKDLFNSIALTIKDYTSDAFDEFDKEDVEGLLKNRIEKGKADFDASLEQVRVFCEAVATSKNREDYEHFFVGEDSESEQKRNSRRTLYKYVARLVTTFSNIINSLGELNYTPEEIEHLKNEVSHYSNVKEHLKLNSGDYIDLKSFEPAMRHLIDTYINAEDSEKVSSLEDMSLVELLVERGEVAINELPDSIRNRQESVAETIENNIRRVIINENDNNAIYFGKMSVLLKEIVALRKQQSIDYAEHLRRIIELAKAVVNGGDAKDYPPNIITRGKRALYDLLEENEALTEKVNETIITYKKHGWVGHSIKEKQILNAIKKHLPEEEQAQEVLNLIKKHPEYKEDS